MKLKFSLFLFIGVGISVVGTLLLALPIQKSEAELLLRENILFQEELALLNGNTLLPISDPSNPEPKVVKSLSVVVTAYSSTLWETDDTPLVTAAGTQVREGIIANNLLPFGTKIKLPELYGEKIFVVEDRMNSRKGYYHVDIWFPSYWEALSFGAKRTYIEVLES